jgi:hypothetical protein
MKRSALPALLVVFVLGFGGGVLVQKYWGVGRLFALLQPTESVMVPQPQADPRPQVDLAALQGKRLMVALVFGQSNSGNGGETRATAGNDVYVFHQGRLAAADDPLPGASGSGGSVWTRLGPRIVERGLADAVVFVPVVVGGSPIERWTPDGDVHPLLVTALDDLASAGIPLTHLLWHQGESDAGRGTPPADYVARFHSMLETFRSRGIDAPVLVSVATLCRAHRPDDVIRDAQRSLVNPELGIFAGPDTDLLGYAYRYDGCHFSTEGLEAFSDSWLAALEAHAAAARSRVVMLP